MIAARPSRLFVAALFLASSLFLAGVSSASVIGNDVIQRSYIDTCNGCSFALSTPFTTAGTVTTWSFYADTTGNSLTPLLYTKNLDGTFKITGIGTTVTVANLGAQTDSFNLVLGSATFTTPTYFGYRDGTQTSANQGTISISDSNSGALMIYFGDGGPGPNTNPAVGESLTPGTIYPNGLLQRDYSLQATAVPVPEPSTWILLVGCLSVLLCWRLGYLRSASVR